MGEVERSDAPRQWGGQLTRVKLEQSLPRQKRERRAADAERKSPVFPAPTDAKKADARLQNTLTQWLITGNLKANPVPANSSIKPFTDAFRDAVHEPQVQAWFRSKGLDLSTARVFSDGVEGTVMIDGAKVTRRFTTTDGSGWWEVGAKVTEALKALSPDDVGVLLPDQETGEFRHVDVILGFYGVKVPNDPKEGPSLGKLLNKDGWPTITDEKRTQWRQQFGQVLQKNDDMEARSQLASQLQLLVNDKEQEDTLDLSDQPAVIYPESTLAQGSLVPRERFSEWLALPAFKTFIEKIGLAGEDNVYRIINGHLELRQSASPWINLQVFLDDEESKVWVGGNSDEKAGIGKLREGFNHLVEMSKGTGNALYSLPMYDVRQFLAFSGLETPNTIAHVNSAIGWLTNKLPPSPLSRDYAGLSPYTWAPGALSPSDLIVLKGKSTGPGSVTEQLALNVTAEGSSSDHNLQLHLFFDSPQAIAAAQQLAVQLNIAEVAGGQPLSRATRHQLLATTIKASVAPDMPGKPGVVAGYEVYQPSNLGRTLDQVRGDIETHLKSKGADAKIAPLIAHMLLAQAAPEFLVKSDPGVSAQAPEALKLSPGQVTIGSTSWINLRLGSDMAEKLGGAGSSRSLNITEAQALTRLDPMGPEHEKLIKTLGAAPLLDWAVMNGVFPRPSDGRYSAGDYTAAAQAFADREEHTFTAFSTLTREPPTQTSLLVDQLASLFPEMTKEQIRNCKLELDTDTPYDPRQHGHLEKRQQLLTDLLLTPFGEKRYKFMHPTISQATFNERIKQLPQIAPMVASAVDQHLADTRSAQETTVRLMVANAPLDVRRALEVGKVEIFTLREETGLPLAQDQQDSSITAEKTARHGVLLRYETGAANPRFGYLEMFPGSMKMIKRDSLPYGLALGGVIERGQRSHGPFAYIGADFRKASMQAFDLQAYQTGTEPRPGASSNVIIEKVGETLPGLNVSQWPSSTPVYVPNSWASKKTDDIAKAIVNVTFDVKRDALIEYANEPTQLHKRRSYPFDSGKIFTHENLRTVLSLIPFVGAIADIADGNISAGLKGLVIDFASFAFTGGLASAKTFFQGLKSIIPFSGRAFTMRAARSAAPFFNSLFNPLAGVSDVFKSGPQLIGASRKVLAGELVSLGPGFYIPTTAFEKGRWGLGAYGRLSLGSAGQGAGSYSGSQLGVTQNQALYAVQIDTKWYAIDPITQKPSGAPLGDFKPDDVGS